MSAVAARAAAELCGRGGPRTCACWPGLWPGLLSRGAPAGPALADVLRHNCGSVTMLRRLQVAAFAVSHCLMSCAFSKLYHMTGRPVFVLVFTPLQRCHQLCMTV